VGKVDSKFDSKNKSGFKTYNYNGKWYKSPFSPPAPET